MKTKKERIDEAYNDYERKRLFVLKKYNKLKTKFALKKYKDIQQIAVEEYYKKLNEIRDRMIDEAEK